MESLEATTHVLHKRAAPYLLVALLGTLPATTALAETVKGDLIVEGAACVGTNCTTASFPFDGLRIHGSKPVLSMVDRSEDGTDTDWSIGITDDEFGGPSEFFIRDQNLLPVLRMNVHGDVALGAGADLAMDSVSVGASTNERRVAHVANAVDEYDAVNKRQFDQAFKDIHDRIDALAARVETLANEVQ